MITIIINLQIPNCTNFTKFTKLIHDSPILDAEFVKLYNQLELTTRF